MFKKSIHLLAIVTVLLAMATNAGWAETGSVSEGGDSSVRYVAPYGSDDGPGTLTAPWRTVRKGLKTIQAGDTLYVRGGRYYERIQNPLLHSGNSNSPIHVTAYPGERPVIEGLLWIKAANYWVFDGLNVTWGSSNSNTEHMVKFTNGVGWTFKNAEVWGAHSYADLLVAGTVPAQPANWTLSSNCIHDTYPTNGVNQDHNIYLNTGLTAGKGVIEQNIIFNATNGENIKIGSPGVASSGSANVSVRYNTLYNGAQSMLVGNMSHDNQVYRNIFTKTAANYGNVRGYRLNGARNLVRDNIGGVAKTLLLNDTGYLGVADAGGNQFPVNPMFDNTASCSGFRPLNTAAQPYGRYAPTKLGAF